MTTATRSRSQTVVPIARALRGPGAGPGFTLIELLVVISIVALLVAILLPTLSSARDNARSMGCLSNERQIGVAFNTYASEYADYMPGAADWWYPGLGENGNWVGQLGYGGMVGASVSYTTYLGATEVHPDTKSWLVFKDPGEQPYYAGIGDDYYRSNVGGRINSWQLWYSRSSYAYNHDVNKLSYFGGVQRGVPRKGWSKGPQKENWFVTVSMAEAPLVTDTMANSAIWWSWTDFPPNSDFQAYVDYSFRHNGMNTTNVLYWDGHALARRRYLHTGRVIWQRLFTHAPDGSYAP